MNKFFHIAEVLVALLKVLDDKTQKTVPLSYCVKSNIQLSNQNVQLFCSTMAVLVINFLSNLAQKNLMNFWWACYLLGGENHDSAYLSIVTYSHSMFASNADINDFVFDSRDSLRVCYISLSAMTQSVVISVSPCVYMSICGQSNTAPPQRRKQIMCPTKSC